MKNKDINNEVEKTLNSLESLQKAEANALMYDKVMERLQKKEAVVVSLKPRIIWQAAACFAALITLNVFVWLHSSSAENPQTQNSTTNTNPLAKEYFSYLNTTQF